MVAVTQLISEAIASGGSIILRGIRPQTYQALLADLGDSRGVRLAYDRGNLEIRMPSKLHELMNRLLERIVVTLTEEFDLMVLPLGSTRFNREQFNQGVEPDSCFYIANADRVNMESRDPPKDIPPDLVIEVDITRSSSFRLNIYKSMQVPEIWRYDRQGFTILQLQNGEYVESEYSLAFDTVSSQTIAEFVEWGTRSPNQNAIVKALRDRIRSVIL